MNISQRIKHVLVFIVSSCFFISSCLDITPMTDNANNGNVQLTQKAILTNPTTEIVQGSDECIQPLEDFSFETIASDPKLPFEKLPTDPWKVEVNIPNKSGNFVYVSMSSRKKEGEEIWVLRYVLNGSINNPNEILVYNNDFKTWKTITTKIGDKNIFAGSLFVTSNNEVWALTSSFEDPTKATPKLAKYDETKNAFSLVADIGEIPSFNSNQVVLDKNDVFWFFIDNDAIYSYNLVSNNVQRHAELTNMVVRNLALSPDGNIYFVTLNYSQQGDFFLEIYQFNSGLQTVEKIHISDISIASGRTFSNILVDSKSRLWLSDLGWKEKDGSWYALLRSPIFITNVVWTGGSSRWATPSILSESYDGRYWFSSENGMAWLDISEKKWCWFTTYQSNIVEDSNQNLWMIADNKLYMLPLNQ